MIARASVPILLLGLAASPALAQAIPEEVARLNEQGLVHLVERRPKEAVESFESALAGLPDSVILRRNLAAALADLAEAERRARRAVEAVALLDRAVELHPGRLRYRVLRGRARYEAGRGPDRFFAREDFAYVLERDPAHLDALVNMGQLCYVERRLEEAVRHWQRASELRPTDRDVRERLERAKRELAVEATYEELAAAKFVVRYGPAIPRQLAETVLTLCETAYGELCARFQHWPETKTVVTLYTPAEFRWATRLHTWVAGLSDGSLRLAVRPTATASSLRPLIYHEYTHHLIRGLAARAPAWLHEGLAQIAEGRSVPAAHARLQRAGALDDGDLSTRILSQSDPRRVGHFYDLALGFTHYLYDEGGGDRGMLELLRALGEGRREDTALRRAYGASRAVLFARWTERLRAR